MAYRLGARVAMESRNIRATNRTAPAHMAPLELVGVRDSHWLAHLANALLVLQTTCQSLGESVVTYTTKTIYSLPPEQIQALGAIAVDLTRLRQNECKHLAVENVGPELFGKLVREYITALSNADNGLESQS